jgi:hypothetical protein
LEGPVVVVPSKARPDWLTTSTFQHLVQGMAETAPGEAIAAGARTGAGDLVS